MTRIFSNVGVKQNLRVQTTIDTEWKHWLAGGTRGLLDCWEHWFSPGCWWHKCVNFGYFVELCICNLGRKFLIFVNYISMKGKNNSFWCSCISLRLQRQSPYGDLWPLYHLTCSPASFTLIPRDLASWPLYCMWHITDKWYQWLRVSQNSLHSNLNFIQLITVCNFFLFC